MQPKPRCAFVRRKRYRAKSRRCARSSTTYGSRHGPCANVSTPCSTTDAPNGMRRRALRRGPAGLRRRCAAGRRQRQRRCDAAGDGTRSGAQSAGLERGLAARDAKPLGRGARRPDAADQRHRHRRCQRAAAVPAAREPAYAPASTFKVLAAVSALQTFGPNYRFVTEMRSLDSPADGVVSGDLWLVGSGDPTLTSDDLRAGAGEASAAACAASTARSWRMPARSADPK